MGKGLFWGYSKAHPKGVLFDPRETTREQAAQMGFVDDPAKLGSIGIQAFGTRGAHVRKAFEERAEAHARKGDKLQAFDPPSFMNEHDVEQSMALTEQLNERERALRRREMLVEDMFRKAQEQADVLHGKHPNGSKMEMPPNPKGEVQDIVSARDTGEYAPARPDPAAPLGFGDVEKVPVAPAQTFVPVDPTGAAG